MPRDNPGFYTFASMNRSPVRYARTSDDVSIAYWTYGTGGPVVIEGPLIPFSHIEAEWQNPHVREWYERVGESVTIVRYDGRGNGLSQRSVETASLEDHVTDLEAVVRHFAPDPVALVGVFHSGPPAALFAARNPELVSHLILWCTYSRGTDYWTENQSEGLRALRQTDYRLFLKTGAHELMGWADDGESDAFADVMQAAVEPEVADAMLADTRTWDVHASLSSITAPTLVVHRRDLKWISVELSRDLASTIPGAQLMQIDGSSPLPAAGPIAVAADAVTGFLGIKGRPTARQSGGGVRVVLFTDLVDHTAMMDELGDELGRAVLREHEHITRGVLADFGGREVKSLGDGFMASFASVQAALDAAIALQRGIQARNSVLPADGRALAVRMGLNAGEPLEEEGDLFGSAVILASRIASHAKGDQILVSNAVRELAIGKRFEFEQQIDFVPKGFSEAVHVWEVRW